MRPMLGKLGGGFGLGFLPAGRRPIPTLQQAWGGKLKGLIDFADLATLTLASGRVSDLVDPVASLTYSQGTSGARPLHHAYGYAIFDGDNDLLVAASNPYVTGSTPCEIIAVVRQDALAADATNRDAFIFGGTAASTARRVGRAVASGVNRGRANVGGDQATGGVVNFSSAHILRSAIGATQFTLSVDGNVTSPVAHVPNTAATHARIGANHSTTPAAFWHGAIAAIAIADPLTTNEWNAGLPWLNAAKARF